MSENNIKLRKKLKRYDIPGHAHKGLHVIGYVIMLNHLHLISYNTDETKSSNLIRRIDRKEERRYG